MEWQERKGEEKNIYVNKNNYKKREWFYTGVSAPSGYINRMEFLWYGTLQLGETFSTDINHSEMGLACSSSYSNIFCWANVNREAFFFCVRGFKVKQICYKNEFWVLTFEEIEMTNFCYSPVVTWIRNSSPRYIYLDNISQILLVLLESLWKLRSFARASVAQEMDMGVYGLIPLLFTHSIPCIWREVWFLSFQLLPPCLPPAYYPYHYRP